MGTNGAEQDAQLLVEPRTGAAPLEVTIGTEPRSISEFEIYLSSTNGGLGCRTSASTDG